MWTFQNIEIKQIYKRQRFKRTIYEVSSQDVESNQSQGQITCSDIIFIASKLIDLKKLLFELSTKDPITGLATDTDRKQNCTTMNTSSKLPEIKHTGNIIRSHIQINTETGYNIRDISTLHRSKVHTVPRLNLVSAFKIGLTIFCLLVCLGFMAYQPL